jgi:hypothetical protein
MILFSYDIVMRDQSMGQPLMRGSLYVRDAESARRHAQTARVPGLSEQPSQLQVILRDHLGLEIWRGPYLGSGGDA